MVGWRLDGGCDEHQTHTLRQMYCRMQTDLNETGSVCNIYQKWSTDAEHSVNILNKNLYVLITGYSHVNAFKTGLHSKKREGFCAFCVIIRNQSI